MAALTALAGQRPAARRWRNLWRCDDMRRSLQFRGTTGDDSAIVCFFVHRKLAAVRKSTLGVILLGLGSRSHSRYTTTDGSVISKIPHNWPRGWLLSDTLVNTRVTLPIRTSTHFPFSDRAQVTRTSIFIVSNRFKFASRSCVCADVDELQMNEGWSFRGSCWKDDADTCTCN